MPRQAIAPQAMVLLHFAAMFAPALLLRRVDARTGRRAAVDGVRAVPGGRRGRGAVGARALELLGLALAHGAAWGLAWAGQLWAPDRRSRQGTSPLRAAIGYAALTLAFGAVVEHFGAAGVVATHAALGLAAALAWLVGASARPTVPGVAEPARPEVRTEGRPGLR